MSRTTADNNLAEYEVSYKETAFSIWYSSGRPSMERLVKLLPEDDVLHRIPSQFTLTNWRNQFAWDDRAAGIDAQVQENTDRGLVEIRMKMMQNHAEMAAVVAEKAFTYLKDGEFDSSAAAVSAFFKAMEAEKSSRGLAGALAKVYSLDDDSLKKEFDRLLMKVSDVGEDVVNAETEPADGPEES